MSSTVQPGGVIPNPADCPAGESAVVEPGGARCIPDAPLGVRPTPRGPSARAGEARLLRKLRPYWGLFAAGAVFASLLLFGITRWSNR